MTVSAPVHGLSPYMMACSVTDMPTLQLVLPGSFYMLNASASNNTMRVQQGLSTTANVSTVWPLPAGTPLPAQLLVRS